MTDVVGIILVRAEYSNMTKGWESNILRLRKSSPCGKTVALTLFFLAALFSRAITAASPAGTIIQNTAASTMLVGATPMTTNSNSVATIVGGPVTLTKSFAAPNISVGGNTALNFVVTNALGNPLQAGIAFVDTLPPGLRLTVGATATISGPGCAGAVALTNPGTISVSGLSMAAGTVSCAVSVTNVTNVAGGNADCSANPPAFTNGPGSISGISNLVNGVTNQCLLVAVQNGVLLSNQTVTLNPGVTYSFPHTLINGPLADSYNLAVTNLPGSFNFSTVQIYPDANGDGIPDSMIPVVGPINLVPNQLFKFVVFVTVPASATGGNFDEVQVTASSTIPGRLPISPVKDHADIFAGPPPPPNIDMGVIKSISTSFGFSPSGPYTVTLRYANVNTPDGLKTNVSIIDALPAGMLYVPGSLRVTPTLPGIAIPLTNASGSFTLEGAAATYDTAGNTISVGFSRLGLNAFGIIQFDVTIAPGIPAGTVVTNIARYSYVDSLGIAVLPKSAPPTDFSVIGTESVTLRGETIPSVEPGSMVSFENLLTNKSLRADRFDITLDNSNYPAGTIFKMFGPDGATPLADTNGNGIADTGLVASGAQFKIVVKAQLPNGAAGGPYSVTKTAKSVTNPLVTASDFDKVGTVVGLCRVTLEPNNSGRVVPGGSIVYTHTLTNVGSCNETIAFPANLIGNLASGWTAVIVLDNPVAGGQSMVGVIDPSDPALTASSTFALAPGASVTILAQVTAPVTASIGTSNTTTLRVNGGNSGILTVNDVTTVATTGGHPTDDITGYIDPGFLRPTIWAFIGKPLYLRAIAPSCNADPTVIERRTIVITGPNGEREEIIAVETGPDTGIFVADGIMTRLPPVVANDTIIEGRPYDSLAVEIVGCGKKIATTVTLIDPSSVVFDSRTNQPVSGATVTLVTATGGRCTATPAIVNQLIAGQIVPAPSSVVTKSDGRYEFPLVAPGDYCAVVNTPNGYTWVSAVPVSRLPPGRNVIATGPTAGGSYGGAFGTGPVTGPVILDIPVDPGLIGGLFVQKVALRTIVEIGEFVDYQIVVSNKSGYALDQADVLLTDAMPAGFTYAIGSARMEGKSIADPQGGVGPQLTFNLGHMAKDQQIRLAYRMRVGPGAMQGDGINRAIANYRPRNASVLFSESNVATAKVTISGGVFTDRAIVIGKVFADCSGNGVQSPDGKESAPDVGIPGIRLYLEDGTNVTTDSEGKFSLYGLSPRTHVLKIDRTTLPSGVELTDLALLSSRHLGKGDSRILDLKNGDIHKANFAFKACGKDAKDQITLRRQVASSLKNEMEGRLQQKLETDPNLRPASDVKALPATGVVGLAAPTANMAAPPTLGSLPAGSAGSTNWEPVRAETSRFDSLATVQSTSKYKPIVDRQTRAPEIPLEKLLPDQDTTLGFIGLKDGDQVAYAQSPVRVKGTAGAMFRLTVNGKEIGADRVGKKAVFAERHTEAWEFIGVNLLVGENVLTVRQSDPFGNARGEKTIKIIAPGALAKIVIEFPQNSKGGVVADGKTPAKIVVRLVDAKNVPITSRTAITVSASAGRLMVEDLNPAEAGIQTFIEGGRAEFDLIPTSDPAEARIKIESGEIQTSAKLDFLPDLRDLIAAGVIEGVLNLRRLDARGLTPARAQDGFEQEITHLARTWNDGKADAGARAAMFLKGKVKGEYLLTLAYDSDKNTRDRLFRDIQPDEFYPIYGDSSVRGFDAQSTGRFYIRVDKNKSYLLYGDYNTSQATDARKLSNYSRSLTGVKEHFESANISANIFASRDSSRQIVDELPANGTSGPFTLTRAKGLINSEKVELLTRDRNQPSIIARALPQTRFVDYELEPLTGRILFKSPVPSLDENLNPISIRVTYEIDQGGQEFWVGGGDVQVKLGERFEVGAMAVDDRNPVDKFRMAGVNAIAKLADKTFLVAELASTRREVLDNAVSSGEKRGNAGRLEFRHSDGNLEATVYAGRADANFDNPSSSLSKGHTEIGGRFAYRLDEKTRIKGELLRTEDTVASGKRDGILLTAEKTLGIGLRVEAGIRHARESQSTQAAVAGVPAPDAVTSVRARVTGDIPGVKDAAAYVEAEVDVSDSARKIAAIGGDYKLGNGGRIYARHEFISSLTGPYGLNSQQRQNATVVGVNADYMKDGNVFSEYRIRDAISGGDAEAALGLRNLWRLADGVALSTGFERVHALSGKGDSEATAGTLGIEYTANPLWKGSARLELRDGKTSDSILATAAAAIKFSRDWTFLGRDSYSLVKNKGASSGEMEQQRLQLGMAYRDTDSDKWNALGRVEHRAENDSTQPGIELKRTVEIISLHANWQPRRPFTFSGRYAAKWTNERSNGAKTTGNAQLLSGRAMWEFAPRWDVSLNTSTMLGKAAQSKYYGLGVELGFMVMENLWLSAGYNVFGYREDDLASGEYTNKGAFFRMRYKFDEDLFAPSKSAKAAVRTPNDEVQVLVRATDNSGEPKGGN